MQEGAPGAPGASQSGCCEAGEEAGPASLEEAAEGATACASGGAELSCLGLHSATVRASGGSLWDQGWQWTTPTSVSTGAHP